MKLATKEELEAHDAATIRGSIEGTLAGLAISLPASFYAQRRWAAYRSLPFSLKVLGVIIVTAPAFAIGAEKRGIEYDESLWGGAGKLELERQQLEQQSRWERLGSKEKFMEWATANQYKIILGSWVVGMGIAGSIIMRNKHQTSAQKIVQVRMWAQGITIGTLIGAGILTQSERTKIAAHRGEDHSWRHMVEEQAEEERQRGLQALGATPSPATA
ncbi:hypothetical protein CERSUDRAFT_80526 [Gelatoporia subvermispora B]|uniref:HIG1 domain-containing protein n=1 Tax=Ceriporiopsis subvermispora (strain B) TaxID=914234 RepID=M2PVS5_CERS8|nr:hypothetical protein CERSUDRAFT_80526 [Gelatoporia subvermispora B]